ncbi:MAG: SDR family oxidoreductase [Hyphomicrobiaceae bacterium]|nr:SDR family oxidoreductase [Hyphomicrobiaceae bacterium]
MPVALVTGGSRRVGRAISLALAADGYAVAVHYRASRAEADALVSEIVGRGGCATPVAADLMDATAVAGLIPAAAAALGPVTCLVNNASEFNDDAIGSMTIADWDRHAIVNLKTPVFLAQAFARSLPDGVDGNVINLIDQRVWNLTPEFFSYTVSKAGLLAANRMLAQALAPRIRVNAIGPGPVLRSVHQTAEDFAAECASTPLGRGSSPDEIAAAVRFILSAPAMTGQMIALDGGQHLG